MKKNLLFPKALVMLIGVALSATGFAIETPSLSNLHLSFTENKGQIISPDVKNEVMYYVKGNNADCFLKKKGVSYVWKSIDKSTDKINSCQMDLEFLNSNPNVKIHAEGTATEISNYYLAHCPKGILDVHSFNKIVYENIYDKIDLIFYVADGSDKANATPIKYDFVVKPGGDPKQIKINYAGNEKMQIGTDGSLTAYCPLGELKEGKPFTYQHKNDIEKNEIRSSYKIEKGHILSFNVSDYDVQKELVIDPSIEWSTYFGGSQPDFNCVMIADQTGNIYLAGSTNSTGLNTLGGTPAGLSTSAIMILAKFNISGGRVWSTYYGTTNVACGEMCFDKTEANIYVTGMADYPAHGSDAFLAKFNTEGALQWEKYLGGVDTDGGLCVAVDQNNNVFMGGVTASTSGIATAGAYKQTPDVGLLAKYNSTGTLQWASYYDAEVRQMAINSQNEIFITGRALISDAISTNGHQPAAGDYDAYITKFNNSMTTVLWSTYFGGSAKDYGVDIKIDGTNNIYLSGKTQSASGIAYGNSANPNYSGNLDDFLAKFNSSGVLQWSTYYGGSIANFDLGYPSSIRFFSDNKVLFGSSTILTSNIATTTGTGEQTNNASTAGNGMYDGYVVKFDDLGNRLWASYVGGPSDDFVTDVAINSSDVFFVAGETQSTSGIASTAPYDNSHNGLDDFFLRKYIASPKITITGLNVSEVFCGANVTLNYTTTGIFNSGNTFTAQLSDGNGVFGTSPTVLGQGPSPMSFTFPSVPAGSTYKIRIVSSNPTVTSNLWGPYQIVATPLTGATINNPIDVGLITCHTNNPQVRNNRCYGDDYTTANTNGQASPDIYYRFNIGRVENVVISTCGSTISTTIHLLTDVGGTIITSQNIPICTGTSSSLTRLLAPGNYIVVVEGQGTQIGDITTKISVQPGMKFNAIQSRVELPINPLLNLGTGSFTIQAYVTPEKIANTAIVSNRYIYSNGKYDGFQFGIHAYGELWMSLNGVEYYSTVNSPNLFDNKCHYVAITRNASNVLKFYADGLLIATKTATAFNVNTAGPIRIGSTMGSNPATDEWVREVSIWNVELTAAQIQNNMNKVLAPQTGLVGYWPLLDGNSQVVKDISGNNLNGYWGTSAAVEAIDPVLICSGCAPNSFIPDQQNATATSIDQSIQGELAVSVYPNPFQNETNVVLSGIKEKAVIEIYHVNGSLVYRNDNYVGNETITLGADFHSGFYMLHVTTQEGSKILKLIKTE